jgi:Chromate transporter.
MVLQFVGFMGAFRDPGGLNPMIAGTLGGMLATWVTFTPCFLWIFLGAPYVEVLRTKRALSAALATITAAIVGVVSTSRSGLRCMCCLPTFTNSASWA